MKTKTYICPKCKKQVSEFVITCPNCQLSLNSNMLQEAEPVDISQKVKSVKTTFKQKLCVMISVVVGIVSAFVVWQSLIAKNALCGDATIDGLLLFRNYVFSGNLQPIQTVLWLSIITLLVSLVVFVVSIVKILKVNYIEQKN